MTDLTEQWRKGELPSGDYYIKLVSERIKYDNIDSVGVWYGTFDDDIAEVLDKVPSYDEWKAAQEQLHKEGVWYTEISHKKVLEENAQLKELLKECKDLIELMQAISGIKQIKFTVIDDFVKKINEVLDA